MENPLAAEKGPRGSADRSWIPFRKGERITIDGNGAGATGRASVPLGDPAPTGKK